jgi:hypothetical protein
MQDGCIERAQALLEKQWDAVEALAGVLLAQGRVPGVQAHRIIQDTIDPTSPDWRMETGTGEEGVATIQVT